MPINLANIEKSLQENINNSNTSSAMLELFKPVVLIKNGVVVDVANTASLPTGSDIRQGVFYNIISDKKIYYYNNVTSKWIQISNVDQPIYMWGYASNGNLGDGTDTARSSPISINVKPSNWQTLSVGWSHVGAIKTDGTLWSWGNNSAGQLGDGTTIARYYPVTPAGGGNNWSKISYGSQGAFTGAIKTDGTLWTWGGNGYGQLGIGNTTSRSSPGTTAGGGTNWSQISNGRGTFAAIKTDGTLWSWGYNNAGQLGDGTITNRSSPGTTAGGGTNWSQVSCGTISTAAIKTDGTLWTWGFNYAGVLGTGNTTSRSSPGTTAGGGTNWSKVSMGASTAAIKTDGTLWTWGLNTSGQLGDGTTTSRTSPGTTAGGGTNWSQIAAGYTHMLAIKTDSTLWTWGSNAIGQLGTGNTTSRSSPGTTSGNLTGWTLISTHNGGTFPTVGGIRVL